MIKNKQIRIRNIVIYMTTFIFFLWVAVSCTKDNDEPAPVNKVLLVYLAADNSLSGDGHDKLEAIRQGWATTLDSRILVYRDATDTSPRLLEIGINNTIKIIEEYECENSADPQVLHRVISKSKALYPQATFNLLVFSHASGWLPAGNYNNPSLRSVVMDGKDEMELSDFAAAIPNNTFEYIIFEACHMAGVEVAYQLRDKARYIAASSAEIVSPGFTYIYKEHLGELVCGDPLKFMQKAFDNFDKQIGYLRSATFSVIKTSGLETLAKFVQTNCDLDEEVDLHDVQHFDRYNLWLFYDFYDYYSRLLSTQEQRQQLEKRIEDVVIWKASTPNFMLQYGGFAINQHSGLTTYINQEQYTRLNESYTTLSWYKKIND